MTRDTPCQVTPSICLAIPITSSSPLAQPDFAEIAAKHARLSRIAEIKSELDIIYSEHITKNETKLNIISTQFIKAEVGLTKIHFMKQELALEHAEFRRITEINKEALNILYSKCIAELATLSTCFTEVEADLAIFRSKKQALASDIRTRPQQEEEVNASISDKNGATKAPVFAKHSPPVKVTHLPLCLASPIAVTSQKCALVCTCSAECYNIMPLPPNLVRRSQKEECAAMPTDLEQLADLAPFTLGSSPSHNLTACNPALTFPRSPCPLLSFPAERTIACTSPRLLMSQGTSSPAILHNQLASRPSGPLQSSCFSKTTNFAHFSDSDL